MAHLSLMLLGSFQATLDGQPAAALTAPRLRALLAYLAVEAGRDHSRTALAGLFWPERPDRESLSALRFALSNLRRAIDDAHARPPHLLITRHAVQFNRAADYRLEVDEFSPAEYETATIEQITAAVALYRGEFLAGLTLDDSPAFEEWLLLKREQCHRQILTFLQQLTDRYEQRDNFEAAVISLRRYLALEPWDEAAHRRLMRLLAFSGQRGAALAQYESCRRLLAGDLGVDPEDDTIRLYQSIRAGTIAPPDPIETAPETAALPPPALFVGRGGELARLEQSLRLALTGQGRVVFVSGEAGGGKTTLLTEFARRSLSTHNHLLFAVGRGAAQGGIGDPYLIFREILGQLTGTIETDWGNGVGRATRIQRLEPSLPIIIDSLLKTGPGLLNTLVSGESLLRQAKRRLFAEARRSLETALTMPPAQTSPPGQPDNLFEQVSAVLQTIARRQPLLLILDDLQWADPASLSLLFHLGRQLGGSRILIAGAYRPSDLEMKEQRHPFQPIIHEFQREWGEIVIDLDQAEGLSFINAYLDSEPNRLDDKFRAKLCQTVGGNPLFTVELVHRLQEQGHLTRDATGYWVAGSGLDWERAPARVEAVIAERLARLPAEWRAMLDVAGVSGEEFSAELVARVLNTDERTVVHILSGPLNRQQRLVQAAGLIRTANGQRLSCYRFRHGLFQRYLYQMLDEAERVALHEAVGRQLEALHGEAAADMAPRLAWHFEAAGVFERAADYYRIAGQHAYRLSAYEEAIDHYRRGLALLEWLPQPADVAQQQARLRCELSLHLGLARPLGVQRGWANPERVRTYERAYDLAHRLADQGEMAPEFLLALYGQITMATVQSELQQALTLSERLLALAQQNQSPLGLGLAHWGLGGSHLFRGECVLGREHLEAAITIYHNHLAGHPDVDALNMGINCLAWLALDLCFLGYPRESLARGQEAVALARRLDNPVGLGLALSIGVCSPYICWRQPQQVQKIAVELQALAQGKNFLPLQAWLEIALGWCQVEAGEFAPGLDRMERGTRSWQQMGAVMGHFWHLGLLAEAYGKAGDVERGLARIEEGLALVRRVGYSQYEPELHRIRGELLSLRVEAAAQAELCFRQAIDLARRQETRWWELRAVAGLARLGQTQGAGFRQEAGQMLAELVAWFDADMDLPDLAKAKALIQQEPRSNIRARRQ